MAATEYYSVVQQVYVAYFGRPADPVGLANFAAQLNAAGAPKTLAGVEQAYATNSTIKTLVDQFGTSAESATLYAGASTAAFVNAIYTNVLNRAADMEGLLYWASAIDRGVLSRGKAALSIMSGALANTSTQGLIDAAVVTNKITVATNFTTALDTTAEVLSYAGDTAAATARALLLQVNNTTDTTAFQALVNSTIVTMGTPVVPVGTTSALTTGVDTLTGTAGNDTFNATGDTATAAATNISTFTALDSINGGAGTDTLNISVTAGAFNTTSLGATVTSIENVNVQSTQALTLDVSGWTGTTNLNVTKSVGAVTATAGSTQAVSVAQADAAVTVHGGSTQTVNITKAGGAIALDKAAGAVNLTVSAQNGQTIDVDNGTDITVTNTASETGGANTIKIGNTTKPTGTVTVVNNLTNAAAAATDLTGSTITVNGGTTVSVTETATQAVMTTASTNSKIVQGDVTVNGAAGTTTVNVAQTTAVAAVNTVLGVTGVAEVNTVTFKALLAGETQIINGLTFTAGAAGTTAAQTAAAFANLDNGAKQGYSTLGTYSGTFNSEGWTSGAVTGTSTVTFTGSAAGTRTNLADTGTGADPTVVVSPDGVAAVTATGKGGVAAGLVSITDVGYGTATADAIKTVSVDGYKTNSFVKSDALTSLTLAHSAAGGVNFDVYDNTATTLALTVNGLGAGSTVNLDKAAATYTALNVTATGADSAANLTAAAVTALTVAGDKAVDLTSSTFTALKTVAVSGSAGVTIDLTGLANQTSVNTTATTGKSTVTLDGTKATFTGGAGVDNVTLTTTGPTKAISLGAGDDSLTLASGTTSATATLSGGDGTDTLVMVAADAATASLGTSFAAQFDGFEKLSLGAASQKTINLDNMDAISYVISAGNTATAEVQNVAVTGSATGQVTFLGHAVAGSANADANTATVTKIVADKVAIIAAWNAAHPTQEIADIAANAGTSLDITFKTSEGNVAALATATSNGATFAAGTESTAGVAGLTLTNMANNGTLELTAAGQDATVVMKDATGTSDAFNIVAKVSTADIDFGGVTVANVESIHLTATDTSTTAAINTVTVDLTATAAKSLTIDGNANVTLTNTANTALTSINASAMTGILTVQAAGTAAETITGGSGNDVIKASVGSTADVLIGGAGADSLYNNAGLSTLTGGDGFDTFYITTASSNVNSYSTITDATKGDYIVFNNVGTVAFNKAAITLGNTAVFQDYANAAINTTTQGQIAWFQFGGDTYIVQEAQASGTAFLNGTDYIVKLTGVVDLSLASFDSGDYTIRIG